MFSMIFLCFQFWWTRVLWIIIGVSKKEELLKIFPVFKVALYYFGWFSTVFSCAQFLLVYKYLSIFRVNKNFSWSFLLIFYLFYGFFHVPRPNDLVQSFDII